MPHIKSVTSVSPKRQPKMSRALQLTKVRTLDTAKPPEAGRNAFVSSGSGLLVIGSKAYVVPDDENHIAMFDLKNPKAKGEWIRVSPGSLPLELHARKGKKMDFESIARVPAWKALPNGGVLIVPSGSGPLRHLASLVPLKADGSMQTEKTPGGLRAKYTTVDFGALYKKLEATNPDLNIEGSVILQRPGREPVLRLVMRGEQGAGMNGFADLSWAKVQHAVDTGEAVSPSAILSVRRFELGQRNGVRLGLSDVAALSDGRMVFTAVAEDTPNAMADGKFTGAAIGVVSAEGKVQRVVAVNRFKVEGIHAELEPGGAIRLMMVDDPDNPEVRSTLLTAKLSPPATKR